MQTEVVVPFLVFFLFCIYHESQKIWAEFSSFALKLDKAWADYSNLALKVSEVISNSSGRSVFDPRHPICSPKSGQFLNA